MRQYLHMFQTNAISERLWQEKVRRSSQKQAAWRVSPIWSTSCLPDVSPAENRHSQGLPCEIGRENQKPGNKLTGSNLRAQIAKKVTVSMTAICAEYALADQVDRHRHQDKAKEKQTKKQNCLPG